MKLKSEVQKNAKFCHVCSFAIWWQSYYQVLNANRLAAALDLAQQKDPLVQFCCLNTPLMQSKMTSCNAIQRPMRCQIHLQSTNLKVLTAVLHTNHWRRRCTQWRNIMLHVIHQIFYILTALSRTFAHRTVVPRSALDLLGLPCGKFWPKVWSKILSNHLAR